MATPNNYLVDGMDEEENAEKAAEKRRERDDWELYEEIGDE